ncbi:MAG: hypothetical protein MJ252_22355, partial [archaeon]|nr:hypothetical protein [archaeon]
MREVEIFDYTSKKFEKRTWESIRVGNIIKIKENEFIPADCVMIYSSEKNQGCFVETKNLDGETNLKLKKGINKIISRVEKTEGDKTSFSEENYFNFQGTLITRTPNEFIYEFNGTFNFNMEKEQIYTGIDSFLLRGCSLKQTKYVYGLVVYTGHNTKIMKNSPNARHKISSVESIMNMQIIFIFISQIILSLIGAIVCVVKINKMDKNSLKYIFTSDDDNFGFLYFIYRLGTWIVLLNNLVPISLLVTMEMVKYVQGFFISWDYNIYDRKTKSMAKVQTSTLNEELGQVKYIFSDKTGTLTKNFMVLKKIAVGTKSYGRVSEIKPKNASKIKLSPKRINPKTESEIKIQSDASFTINKDQSIQKEHGNNIYNSNSDNSTLIDGNLPELSLEDEYGKCTNIEFNDQEFTKDMNNPLNMEQKESINLFLQCILTCHSINVDEKEYESNKKIIYQSSSPDETAILNLGRLYKYVFMGRDLN